MALYAVTTQSARERFSEGTESDTTSKSESTSAQDGEHDAEATDGMVFKSYLDTFGVPPTPDVSKHYASVVAIEKLDEAKLRERLAKDAAVVAKMRVDTMTTESSVPSDPATASTSAPSSTASISKLTGPEMDAEMQALREKAANIAKMSDPIPSPESSAAGKSAEMVAKLRGIAGQVSALARQYETPGISERNTPKGIESFISF